MWFRRGAHTSFWATIDGVGAHLGRLAGLFSGGFRPTPGFLSLSKVRPATSAQVLPAKHCCSRRIVG